MSVTEFTNDWAQFEARLAGFLERLAQPTLNDTVRLRYPTADDALGEIILEGTFGGETSDIGLEPRGRAYLIGVSVTLPAMAAQFYPIAGDSGHAPKAASVVCTVLREESLVAHPSLLAAEADRIGWDLLDLLGLPSPDGIPREDGELPQNPGRIERHGDRQPAKAVHDVSTARQSWPGLSWPASVDEVNEAIEQVLVMKYGTMTRDSDDDFVIDSTHEGGTRFYLTVINDRPITAFRKAVVLHVNCRQSAVVEANYLNREVADIRWVLRGYTLYQELSFPTAPFVPMRFVEMLDQFGQQYRDNVSALRMRLGGDS
jgi:hypothetical protein